MTSFSEFGLLSSLQKTLKEKKLHKPTEIQVSAIPALMAGKSVVGISETGSGKTLAYALPLLHLLKTLENQGEPVREESTPRAIVIVPTRDLGEQISKVFKSLTHDTRLRVRPALGGMALEQATRNISGAFEILLATPGRLIQLMQEDRINLTDVRMLIFDEADQMLDPGFLPGSKAIVAACPKNLQKGLFSATVSPVIESLMSSLFSSAEVIRSKGSGKVVKSLVTKNLFVEDGKRWPLLEKILAQPTEGGTLLFTNTREQCDRLAKELTSKGFSCGVYRGEMEKNERRTTLKRFRSGDIDLLVATDLAGRGLDIDSVGRVINYHLPQQLENYLHRVGRTARAGREGLVINLITERDEALMAKLEGRKPAAKPVLKAGSRPGSGPKAPTKESKGPKGLKGPKGPKGHISLKGPKKSSRPSPQPKPRSKSARSR